MAKLSDMILGQTARTQDLIDRPATLLRRGEENRLKDLAAESNLKDLAAESNLKTAKQGRKLALTADERADAAGKRAERTTRIAESAEGRLAGREPIVKSQMQLSVEALKNENFQKGQETAQKYVAPVVQQMIELNKQYLETGDANLKVQRDKLLDQFAGNPAMKAYVGMTPQFHELAGINKMHLYNTEQSPDEKEQEIQSLMMGLGKSDQVYKTWQQEQATKSAAFVLSQQVDTARQVTKAKGMGETDAMLDQAERFNEAGIEAPKEPLSEGQQARVQKTFASFFTNSVLKEAGANAGKLWFAKNLDEGGEFSKAVANMPEAMFTEENPRFISFFSTLNSDAFKGKSNADKNAAIDRILASDMFSLESPFRAKLNDLKKTALSNLRDVKSIKPQSVL